jgi:hypothetical protein
MYSSDTDLHAVVFVSSSTINYSKSEMQHILTNTREHNRINNITGLLIFGGGNMLRMMEGTKETVQAEFYSIQEDNLQREDTIKLIDKPIKQRYFEDYPLAFKPLNSQSLKHFDDFKEPESREFFEECLATDDSVMKIVKDFLKHNT